jgi:hypothetical protein
VVATCGTPDLGQGSDMSLAQVAAPPGPLTQVIPQPPQCMGLFMGSTHTRSQHVWFAPHPRSGSHPWTHVLFTQM